jgi:hypothetical protein
LTMGRTEKHEEEEVPKREGSIEKLVRRYQI